MSHGAGVGLILGLIILILVPFIPFTEQFARESVPRSSQRVARIGSTTLGSTILSPAGTSGTHAAGASAARCGARLLASRVFDGPGVSTLSVSGCRLRCRIRRWAAASRRASSVAVRDARQRWWQCGRGSRQRSSCRRGLGSVCADGSPSGGRQRASGG
jgi:hypothetical protein